MSINYRASVALTTSIAGLGTSSSLTIGRCSAAYSNSAKDDFVIPTLKVRTNSVSPTAGGQLELWAFEQRADSTWPEIFTASYTGTDGNFTVLSRDILMASCRFVGSVTNDATASRDYVVQGKELSTLFGYVPQNFAFFITQSSGQALDSTSANHALVLQPAYLA